MMHGQPSIKICTAEQAKNIHQYKNNKLKLHKTNAAIWYNKSCNKSVSSWKRNKVFTNDARSTKHKEAMHVALYRLSDIQKVKQSLYRPGKALRVPGENFNTICT